MPSLVMYLAIAKKYLEKHPEENEEEFIEGILAPDRRRTLSKEKSKLHYSTETAHRPDLNRYYYEQGLNSSYNRGYFLNLLTDYLFYNKFLNEYSSDIFNDYRIMNKKIQQKYDIKIPEQLKKRINYRDGELKSISEESVYKFIDTTASLDLEKYKEQVSDRDNEHNIKIIGLKEGLLYKHNEPNYFNSHDEEYFYGFENNYGIHVQRKIGLAETEGAKEGLYQVTPYGIAAKPSKIMKFDIRYLDDLTEDLDDELSDEILEMCEQAIGNKISRDACYNFERIKKDDVIKILKLIRSLPERKPEKEITDRKLNTDLINIEQVEIE